HDRAIERHAGEKASGARIGVDLRIDASRGFALAAHGSGGHRGVGAQSELAPREVLNAARRRKYQHHIGRGRATLPADAAAGEGYEDRVAEPPGSIAHGQNAVAMAPTED